jgi:hypothetical protein
MALLQKSFWRMHCTFLCSRRADLFFPVGRLRHGAQLVRWYARVKFGSMVSIDRPEKVTVILLNYKRPWNMSMLVRMLLKCEFVEKILLCNNGAQYPVSPKQRDARVQVVTLSENAFPIHRFVLAREESAEHFLFLDDDLLLTPEQVRDMVTSLLKDTTHIHGICGECVEGDSIKHYLHGKDMELTILNRAYACTAEHIANFFTLLGGLTQRELAVAPFRDDIILSMSSEHAPRCHNVGNFLSCPSCSQHNVAVFQNEEFTDRSRLEFYHHLRSNKESACITNADVEHLYGPMGVETTEKNMVVVCLMRDAELTITSFIEHYLSLGAAHIVLLDNDSNDRTVELASAYDNVSIFRCGLPFAQYQLPMKRWLAREFCTGCWCLSVDSDELFLYPEAEEMQLPDFLHYLRSNSFTAASAHMLDMFADCSLQNVQSAPQDNVRKKYPYYDLEDIHEVLPEVQVKLTRNSDLRCLRGGIRKTLFGSGNFLLTKTPLFFVDDDIQIFPQNEHFVEGVTIADVTGVLLHYKMLSSFREKAEDAVRRKNHWRNSLEYTLYLQGLDEKPNISPMSNSASKWQSTSELVDRGFLVVPSQYKHAQPIPAH